jgi:hypothetical protein
MTRRGWNMYEEVILVVNITVRMVRLLGGLLLLCDVMHGHGAY